MKPTLSVIIPTYHRDDSLCRTLETLLAQDWKDFEIIVVDQLPQHSKKTEQYLDSIREQIHYVVSLNPNLPAGRNTGIKASLGRIIVFFDDDIDVPPSTLTQLVKSYDNHQVDGVCGFVIFREQTGNGIMDVSFEKYYHAYRDREQLLPVQDFIGGFMSFRRDVFAQVGYFDEWMGAQPSALGEDFEFSYRLRVAGKTLFLNTSVQVFHQSELEGGCGKAQRPMEEKQLLSMKMCFYTYLKNRQNDRLDGLLIAVYKCYRSYVLNRSIFSINIVFHWKRHQQFFRALRFALKTSREQRMRNLHEN